MIGSLWLNRYVLLSPCTVVGSANGWGLVENCIVYLPKVWLGVWHGSQIADMGMICEQFQVIVQWSVKSISNGLKWKAASDNDWPHHHFYKATLDDQTGATSPPHLILTFNTLTRLALYDFKEWGSPGNWQRILAAAVGQS